MTFRRLISLIPYSLSLRAMRHFAIPTLVIVAALAIRVGYAAWVEPAVGPTGGTPPPPINTSGFVQTKTGGLNIATTSGQVGIGTTNPGTVKLFISSGASPALRVDSSAESIFSNSDSYLYIQPIYGGDAIGYVRLGAWDNAGAFQGSRPLAFQPAGGNVGIGTTNPTYRLDVNGGMRANFLQDNQAGWYVDADVTSVMNSIDLRGSLMMQAGQIISSTGRLHIQAAENLFLNPWAGASTVYVGGGGGPGNLYATGNINASSFTGRDATFVYNNGTHVLRNDGGSVYLWPWGTGAASSNIVLGGGVGGIGLNATGPIYEMSGNRVCTAANGLCGGVATPNRAWITRPSRVSSICTAGGGCPFGWTEYYTTCFVDDRLSGGVDDLRLYSCYRAF